MGNWLLLESGLFPRKKESACLGDPNHAAAAPHCRCRFPHLPVLVRCLVFYNYCLTAAAVLTEKYLKRDKVIRGLTRILKD